MLLEIFLCVELSGDTRDELQSIADTIDDSVSPDHVTLVYVPTGDNSLDDDVLFSALTAARDVASRHAPITARTQGWAYFDGTAKNGQPATALVCLVDAPGLAELHVDLVRALRVCGVDASTDHGFNPHVTFAWLPRGGRVDDLPVLDTEFVIDEITAVSNEIEKIALTGSLEESLIRCYVSGVVREGDVNRSFGGGSADERRMMFDEPSVVVPDHDKRVIKKWVRAMKLSEIMSPVRHRVYVRRRNIASRSPIYHTRLTDER